MSAEDRGIALKCPKVVIPILRTATGVAAVLGGAAWIGACLAQDTAPQGCIGVQCEGRAMREAPDSAILLGSLAGVFVAASVVGLLMLARQRGGLGRASVAGASACGIGLGLLVAAGVVSRLNSDFSGMPALVVPGVLCLVVGFLLIAWALFRSGVVPKWLAACVVACALLLLVANEQTSRILLAVPFGLAWMLLGIVVLTQASASNRTKSSSS